MPTIVRRLLILVPLAVALAAVYAFLPLTVSGIDNSPDEAANRAFATEFAHSGHLWRAESLDAMAPDIVHPRSVRIVNHVQVPVGFIGLPVLYGGVAAVLGTKVIPFLTPLMAALAVLAWAGIAAKLFGDMRIGVLAGGLLAVQPAWWYAASRTLQPNVLFASLLIGALWFFSASSFKGVRRAVPAGMLLGLALAVRPSEAYWIALGIIMLLVVLRDGRAVKDACIALACAGVMLVPFFVTQHGLYGSIFATGYGATVGTEIAGAATGGNGAKLLGPLRPYLFPLGFAPRLAASTFLTYGIAFFRWWSVLVGIAIAALAFLALRRTVAVTRQSVATVGAILLLTLWLILFYGSWVIQDNPDPTAVTIGASYLRYWLPIFVVSTLPVAWLLGKIAALVRNRIVAGLAVVAFIFVVGAVSAVQIFSGDGESLLSIRANLERYAVERDAVLAATEQDAVIVVDRSDKVLYPHRSVVTPLRSDRTYAALPALAAARPTYYLGITLPETDLAWLNTEKLPPLGLSIAPVQAFSDQTLYRFTILTPKP
jgi:hypothetical protein